MKQNAVLHHVKGTEDEGHVGVVRKRDLIKVLGKDLSPAFPPPPEHEHGLREGCAQTVFKECSIAVVAQMVQTCFMFYS